MFHTVLRSIIVPLATTTVPPAPPVAGGHSPFNPVADGNFPGGSLIAQLVNFALYGSFAACAIGFIYGAGTLWASNAGHMAGAGHHKGVRAIAGSVIGAMLLATISSFI